MHYTFEISDFNRDIDLENHTIDNSGGDLTVCLKDVSFWIGFYNISKGESIKWRSISDMATHEPEFIIFEPGLYNINDIKMKITAEIPELYFYVSKNSDRVQVDVPNDIQIKLSPDIANILSLPHSWINPGEHIGKIDLQPFKAIYLHCNKISTTDNIFNGKPSTLLSVIPIADNRYGSNTYIQFAHEVRKPLERGIISSLNFSLLDEKDQRINNRGLPIILSLEIK